MNDANCRLNAAVLIIMDHFDVKNVMIIVANGVILTLPSDPSARNRKFSLLEKPLSGLVLLRVLITRGCVKLS